MIQHRIEQTVLRGAGRRRGNLGSARPEVVLYIPQSLYEGEALRRVQQQPPTPGLAGLQRQVDLEPYDLAAQPDLRAGHAQPLQFIP